MAATVTTNPLLTGKARVKSLNNPNTAVVIGDSRTANGYVVGAVNTDLSARGYFCWANVLLKQRLEFLNYAGVSGETTTQILARFSTQAVAYNPGWIFLWAGNNDIAASTAVSTITANLQLMYEMAEAAGIRVLAFTETPRTNSTAAFRSATFALNQWIRNYCREHDNVILIDAFEALIDATSATVQPKTSSFYDTTHPSSIGAFRVAQRVYTALVNIVPATPSAVSSINDNYATDATIKNGLQYGLFQGIAGTNSASATITGSVATGWTLAVAANVGGTVAMEAATSGAGNAIVLALTPTGAQTVTLTADASVKAGMIAGNDVWAECDIEVSGTGTSLSVLKGITLQLLGQSGGLFQTRSLVFGTEALTDTNYVGRTRLPKITIPAGTFDTAALSVSAYFTAADAGVVTIKLSNMAVIYD